VIGPVVDLPIALRDAPKEEHKKARYYKYVISMFVRLKWTPR
jgi:hypothetical protein